MSHISPSVVQQEKPKNVVLMECDITEIRAFLQQSASIRFHSTVPNNKWNNCCTLGVCQTFCTGNRALILLKYMQNVTSPLVCDEEKSLLVCGFPQKLNELITERMCQSGSDSIFTFCGV